MKSNRHIKLPRKRKKEAIKHIGRKEYMMARIMNGVLDQNKFPILKLVNNKVKTLGFY